MNLRSLINTFVARFLDSIIPTLANSNISRLLLVSVAEQAGLSVTWSENPEDRGSRDEAQILNFWSKTFINLSLTITSEFTTVENRSY